MRAVVGLGAAGRAPGRTPCSTWPGEAQVFEPDEAALFDPADDAGGEAWVDPDDVDPEEVDPADVEAVDAVPEPLEAAEAAEPPFSAADEPTRPGPALLSARESVR